MTADDQNPVDRTDRPSEGSIGKAALYIDRLVRAMARHWLAIFNSIATVFVLLPFLAPVLMHRLRLEDSREQVEELKERLGYS